MNVATKTFEIIHVAVLYFFLRVNVCAREGSGDLTIHISTA